MSDYEDFSDSERQQQLIQALAEIVDELGWVIGIPLEEGSNEKVHGLIIGTEEFVNDVVQSTGMEVDPVEIVDSPDSVKTNKKLVH